MVKEKDVHSLWTLVKYILIPTFGTVSFRTLANHSYLESF